VCVPVKFGIKSQVDMAYAYKVVVIDSRPVKTCKNTLLMTYYLNDLIGIVECLLKFTLNQKCMYKSIDVIPYSDYIHYIHSLNIILQTNVHI
jgi:hypothetical protein